MIIYQVEKQELQEDLKELLLSSYWSAERSDVSGPSISWFSAVFLSSCWIPYETFHPEDACSSSLAACNNFCCQDLMWRSGRSLLTPRRPGLTRWHSRKQLPLFFSSCAVKQPKWSSSLSLCSWLSHGCLSSRHSAESLCSWTFSGSPPSHVQRIKQRRQNNFWTSLEKRKDVSASALHNNFTI